jgi:uncharacterized protein (TIGR01370 family)
MAGTQRINVVVLVMTIIFQFTGCKTMNEHFFAVVYGKVKPADVANYKMVILDPDHYTKAEIDAFHDYGLKVIAYLSLGEVDPNRWYFPYFEKNDFILGKNKYWNSYYINLKKKEVHRIFLQQIIPNILIKGFDGLFFDTVDAVAPYTERKNMMPDMSRLIHSIRNNWKDIYLIQNGGLFLLDETQQDIQAVLVEDVVTSYDFVQKKYLMKETVEFEKKIRQLQLIQKKYQLPVLIIDYADSRKMYRNVKKILDDAGFNFFISTIDLNQLPGYK